MFKNIPKHRIVLYFLLVGFLPVVFVFFMLFSQYNDVTEIRSYISDLKEMAALQERKQFSNLAARKHFKDADHFYIDKHLETMIFLEPEIESLQKILNNKNVAEDETAKKRLEFLTGSGNSLIFSEGVVQTGPFFQETTETLVHAVEINAKDLQKILTRIEGIEIGENTVPANRPQLIILDLKLDKKAISTEHEVFLLNLKLLKREYL